MYLAHPRTASQATAAALAKVGFRKVMPGDHHSRFGHSGLVRDEWTIFTTVRNHWDAVVSWLTRQREPDPWTLDLLANHLDTNNWVKPDRLWWLHLDDADFVMRYEALQRDLARVLETFGVDVPEVDPVNVTDYRRGRDYHEFYTDETREFVGDRFREEIAMLGYSY